MKSPMITTNSSSPGALPKPTTPLSGRATSAGLLALEIVLGVYFQIRSITIIASPELANLIILTQTIPIVTQQILSSAVVAVYTSRLALNEPGSEPASTDVVRMSGYLAVWQFCIGLPVAFTYAYLLTTSTHAISIPILAANSLIFSGVAFLGLLSASPLVVLRARGNAVPVGIAYCISLLTGCLVLELSNVTVANWIAPAAGQATRGLVSLLALAFLARIKVFRSFRTFRRIDGIDKIMQYAFKTAPGKSTQLIDRTLIGYLFSWYVPAYAISMTGIAYTTQVFDRLVNFGLVDYASDVAALKRRVAANLGLIMAATVVTGMSLYIARSWFDIHFIRLILPAYSHKYDLDILIFLALVTPAFLSSSLMNSAMVVLGHHQVSAKYYLIGFSISVLLRGFLPYIASFTGLAVSIAVGLLIHVISCYGKLCSAVTERNESVVQTA